MKKILLILVLFFVVFGIDAATPGASFAAKPQAGFTENKGQIVDQNRQQNQDVLFLLNGNGLNVQIRKGGFSYDTYTIERKAKEQTQDKDLPKNVKNVQDSFDYIYHYHRVDVDFENANKLPEVKRGKALLDYLNYYNVPNVPEGVVNVYSYKSILVKNIYPGIDIEYLVDAEKGFKYNFIVHPGANYHLIQMKYAGAESKLIENKIELSVDAGKLQEDIPQSWLAEDKAHLVNVGYKQIAKGVFGFEMDAPIASNKTLIIDPIPNRIWGTYYGGTFTSRGESCDIDAIGNVYLSVRTNSSGSMATSGAFQISLAGSYDFCLAKFDALGTRQWGTYYGGTGDEFGSKCAVDINDNIYLVGATTSTTNISTTGSHQILPGGLFDLFLVKFNTNGTRIWGTYYAGLGTDQRPNIATDPSGNIIISGETNSMTNISTIGSFQASYAGGNFDLFLAKFNSNGVRLWATYYGGANSDALGSCAVDNSGNVFLIGTTESAGLSTVGAHQAVLSTNYDAIIIKFNSSGARQWSTYYGGTASEYTTSCTVDLNGNILFLGHTESLNAIASIGASQTILGGLADVFLVKLNTLGVRQWGTYYGGTQFEESFCVKSDPIGNVYISGITESTTSISTIDAYQTTYMGGRDGFFSRFNSAGIRQYGSYYGGVDYEGAMVCSIRSNGTIYLAGETYSPLNISTLGSHQPSLGGIQNAFLVKMFDCSSIGSIGSISQIGGATTCNGTAKQFSISAVINATGHQWTVPAGWLIQSGQGSTIITVIPNSTGTLTVKGYNGCGDSTTAASLAVTAITNATPSAITGSATPCYGVAATYSVTLVAGNTYEWVLPSTWGGSPSSNSILVNAFATPATGGDSIFVRAIKTTTSCPSAYVKKRVDASRAPISPSVVYGVNPACKTVATVFSVDSLPFANTYTWTFPTGWTIGTPATNRQITVTPGATAVAGNVTVKGTNTVCGAGPIYTQALLAPVSAPAQPGVITGASAVCAGITSTYSIAAVSGANSYLWQVPTGWTILSGQGTISLSVTSGTAAGQITVSALNGGNNSCVSVARTLPVSINVTPPAPSITTYPTAVCRNSVYTLGATTVSGAISYSWTLPTGLTVNANNTSISNITNLYTASSIAASNTIELRANNTTCASAPAIIYVTGNNNLPSLTGAISGNTTMCANSIQTYFVTADAVAANYNWVFPSGWSVVSGNGTNSIQVQAGLNTGPIEVTAINGACWSNKLSTSVTNVNPSPSNIGLISFSGVNCSGKSNTLSIAAVSGASSYTWTLPIGWSGSSTSTSIAVTPGIKSDTVMVTATNGTCSSLPRKQLITAYETPAQPGPINGASTICINSQNIYKINRQSNVSNYLWTWPANYTIVANADTAQTIVANSSALSGNLSLVANNNGCQSAATLFPITLNKTIPGTPGGIIGGTTICNGIPKTFSVGLIPNALSYKWTVPATWTIVSGQNTAQVSIRSDNTTGQITVKSVNGACESAAQILNINGVLVPPGTPIISTNLNPCLNQNALFAVSNAGGASVIWTAPAGWTISNQNQANTNILIAGMSGTISAIINNGDCEGPPANVDVVAISVPEVSEIDGEKYVKANSVRFYTVQPLPSTTYSWAVPADWHLLSGNGTEKIAVMTGSSSGFITVYAQNNCGSSAPYNYNVYSSVSASIDEAAFLGDIKVFPQPAKDFFTLSFMALKKLDQPKIVLTDMLGKTIFSRFEPNLALGQIYEGKFSCEGLTPGIYFLQIQDSNTTQTIKISINP